MKQITEQQAITIYKNKLYEDWSDTEKVEFQLWQDRLSMPFDIFHTALVNVLERSVYTHEMGRNREGLKKEFLGEVLPPTFEDIIKLIPSDKLILIS